MMSWIQNHWKSAIGLPLMGVICFVAGQITPSYFTYVDHERARIADAVSILKQRGDEAEQSFKTAMEIAEDRSDQPAATIEDMNSKLFGLYQAISTVGSELSSLEPEQSDYIDALKRVRSSADVMTSSLNARQFVEALSRYKLARDRYEAKVAMQQPTFLSGIGSNFH